MGERLSRGSRGPQSGGEHLPEITWLSCGHPDAPEPGAGGERHKPGGLSSPFVTRVSSV